MAKKRKTWIPVPGAGRNIYRHAKTKRIRVIWQDRGDQREESFDRDTPVARLIAFRNQKQSNALDATATGPASGTFTRDGVAYLKTRKGMECYKSERSHLRPWLKIFGKGSRFAITHEKISQIVADWRTRPRPNEPGKVPEFLPPLTPKTIRHRMHVLRAVFKFKDGDQPNPCDRIVIPKGNTVKRAAPPDSMIGTVAAKLKRQEVNGRLRDGKTRARYLVLATTGKRPCQMQRTSPDMVNLEARWWNVPAAKNSDGGFLYLNNEMLEAWTLFVAANAWGKYDSRSFSLTLRRNGWPGGRGGIPPYRMRHQTLQTLSNRGADFELVQQAADHLSPITTKRHYVPHTLEKSKRAGDIIDGRFDPDVFTPRAPKPFDPDPSNRTT